MALLSNRTFSRTDASFANLFDCHFLRLNRVAVSKKEYFFVKLPFQIYFGWITVATIANVTALLVDYGWTGWGLSETFWTIAVIAVATLIAISVILKGRAVAYGLTVIWAFSGIIAKHVSANGFADAYPQIITETAICIGLLLLCCLYVPLKNKKTEEGNTFLNQ
jgi:hypothetical protein